MNVLVAAAFCFLALGNNATAGAETRSTSNLNISGRSEALPIGSSSQAVAADNTSHDGKAAGGGSGITAEPNLLHFHAGKLSPSDRRKLATMAVSESQAIYATLLVFGLVVWRTKGWRIIIRRLRPYGREIKNIDLSTIHSPCGAKSYTRSFSNFWYSIPCQAKPKLTCICDIRHCKVPTPPKRKRQEFYGYRSISTGDLLLIIKQTRGVSSGAPEEFRRNTPE